jgi:hypothetical protein
LRVHARETVAELPDQQRKVERIEIIPNRGTLETRQSLVLRYDPGPHPTAQ